MKHIITITILLVCFFGFSQEKPNTEKLTLLLFGNEVIEGDFVDVDSFSDLTVRGASQMNLDEIELQFVIVPIGLNMLSFNVKVNELKNLDMKEMLSIGGIPREKITHSIIIIKEKEIQISSTMVSAKKYTTADELYTDYLSYLAIGDSDMAKWSIEQLIKLDPTNINYQNIQGQLYFDLKEYSFSKKLFESIIANHPNYLSFQYLAFNLFQLGEFENSIKTNEKAMKFTVSDNDKSNLYTSIGDGYGQLFNYKMAYSNYKMALEKNPNNITALNNISTVCEKVGKGSEKIAYLNRVVDIDPSYYLIHVNIGFYYLKENNFDYAIKEFDMVLSVDPLQPIALNNKAFCLYKLNKLSEARELIDKAIEQLPSNSYAYKNRALIKIALGENLSACEDLDIATQLNYTQQYGNEVNELKLKYCKERD